MFASSVISHAAGWTVARYSGLVRFLGVLLICSLAILLSQQAPPAITPGAIVNAASLLPPSLPGGGVPRGGLVALYGPRLQLDKITIQAGGREFRALPQFRSETHVTAYVPPEVPVGDATLTVTYQGQTSVGHPIRVAASAGIFGLRPDSFSCSDAARFLDRREAIAPTSLEPGAAAMLFATGVSPEAKLLISGRTVAWEPAPECVPGLQRFRFTVPADLPKTCANPVVIATPGSTASNYVSLPTRGCAPESTWLTAAAVEQKPVSFVMLLRAALRLEGKGKSAKDTYFDAAMATFGVRLGPPGDVANIWPPVGQCTVVSGITAAAAFLQGKPVDEEDRLDANDFLTIVPRGPRFKPEYPILANLDFGPALTVNNRGVPRDAKHPQFYFAALGGNPPVKTIKPSPRFWKPGPVHITGPGGSDGGGFEIQGRFPEELVWTNRDRIDSVDRSKGVTVEWKAPKDLQSVAVFAAAADSTDGASSLCLCAAPAAASSFTIPPEALSNLPSSLFGASYYNVLAIAAAPSAEPVHTNAKGGGTIYAVPLSLVGKSVAFP